MPAEYWYVPRVIYVQKFHPTRSLFILTWGGVWCRFLVLLSIPASFPWPIHNNFVTVGCSRVSVGLLLARLCFNCVY